MKGRERESETDIERDWPKVSDRNTGAIRAGKHGQENNDGSSNGYTE